MHAAANVLGTAPAKLDRANSYIAVMIDDLVLQGVTEPYRMLTARAEYRLRLRADNASTRLTPIAMDAGCLSSERTNWFNNRQQARDIILKALESIYSSEDLVKIGIEVRRDGTRQSLFQWDWKPLAGMLLKWLGRFRGAIAWEFKPL